MIFYSQNGKINIGNNLDCIKLHSSFVQRDDRIVVAVFAPNNFADNCDINECKIIEASARLKPIVTDSSNVIKMTNEIKNNYIKHHVISFIAKTPASMHYDNYSLSTLNKQYSEFLKTGVDAEVRVCNYLNKYILFNPDNLFVAVNDEDNLIGIVWLEQPICYSYTENTLYQGIAERELLNNKLNRWSS